MDGVQLGARFSIATNRLNFCGPADAEPTLYAAIRSPTGGEAARQALGGFEALMPYLEAIAARHDLSPFDARVVEAYWIGNDLLDAFGPAEFRTVLAALVRRGLPASIAGQLVQHLPAAPIPHHMFHVAFVGVGAVTGHVPTTLANMEACRPAWATVLDRGASGMLRISRPALRLDRGRLVLGAATPEEVRFDPAVVPDAAPGREVVLHWGWPALVLAPPQAEALRRYTGRALDAANEALPGLGTFGAVPGP
ncbi:MAG: DUF6390 family protein [Thermoplasmata archaeon]